MRACVANWFPHQYFFFRLRFLLRHTEVNSEKKLSTGASAPIACHNQLISNAARLTRCLAGCNMKSTGCAGGHPALHGRHLRRLAASWRSHPWRRRTQGRYCEVRRWTVWCLYRHSLLRITASESPQWPGMAPCFFSLPGYRLCLDLPIFASKSPTPQYP